MLNNFNLMIDAFCGTGFLDMMIRNEVDRAYNEFDNNILKGINKKLKYLKTRRQTPRIAKRINLLNKEYEKYAKDIYTQC